MSVCCVCARGGWGGLQTSMCDLIFLLSAIQISNLEHEMKDWKYICRTDSRMNSHQREADSLHKFKSFTILLETCCSLFFVSPSPYFMDSYSWFACAGATFEVNATTQSTEITPLGAAKAFNASASSLSSRIALLKRKATDFEESHCQLICKRKFLQQEGGKHGTTSSQVIFGLNFTAATTMNVLREKNIFLLN